MDKAIEAAAKALWPTAHKDMSDFMLHALKDCLRAYLSALKEDPEVVERVARALASISGRDPEEFEVDARAALSALEVE